MAVRALLLLVLLLAPLHLDARKSKTKKAKSNHHAATGPMLLSSDPNVLNKQAAAAFGAKDYANAVKAYTKLRTIQQGGPGEVV